MSNDTADQIRRNDAEWAAALAAGDVEGLRRMMLPECEIAHGSGVVESRDSFLNSVYGRIEIRDPHLTQAVIHCADRLVVVTGVWDQHIRPFGTDDEFRLARTNVTRVWANGDDGWKLLRHHGTRVPAPDA